MPNVPFPPLLYGNLFLNDHTKLQVEIGKLVNAMGGVLQTRASADVSFVIAKNALAAKYKVVLLELSHCNLLLEDRLGVGSGVGKERICDS